MAVIVLGLALLKFREIIARRIIMRGVACWPSPTTRCSARPETHDTPFIMPFIFRWRGALRSHYQSVREIGPPITACRTSTRMHWAGVGLTTCVLCFCPHDGAAYFPLVTKSFVNRRSFLVASRRISRFMSDFIGLELASVRSTLISGCGPVQRAWGFRIARGEATGIVLIAAGWRVARRAAPCVLDKGHETDSGSSRCTLTGCQCSLGRKLFGWLH
jgi:hypothetical protein